ncbi:hypothetical protein CTEN210_05916 [Chaetoceros tenuissimus]|uniref:Uncharacterized protein n=1 Tax=Chaetoceros tenuissimus TaxID=426638 RepID=A0AAD3CRC6_9STRA|nr:hypothetical protein CTEN210_05916 [Chaetoceros tenuissimus]
MKTTLKKSKRLVIIVASTALVYALLGGKTNGLLTRQLEEQQAAPKPILGGIPLNMQGAPGVINPAAPQGPMGTAAATGGVMTQSQVPNAQSSVGAVPGVTSASQSAQFVSNPAQNMARYPANPATIPANVNGAMAAAIGTPIYATKGVLPGAAGVSSSQNPEQNTVEAAKPSMIGENAQSAMATAIETPMEKPVMTGQMNEVMPPNQENNEVMPPNQENNEVMPPNLENNEVMPPNPENNEAMPNNVEAAGVEMHEKALEDTQPAMEQPEVQQAMEVVEPELEVTDIPVEVINDERPIMHTFYHPVDAEGCCGMSAEAHLNLLRAWEDSWQAAGWRTRVLRGEDAHKHPDFDRLNNKLIELEVDPYNRRCFWRWLAMASDEINGGWMSDYDVFPLTLTAEKGLELQDEGFQTWAAHVPALIHADKESWNKIINMMIDEIPTDFPPGSAYITDMNMLQFLHFSKKKKEMNVTTWKMFVNPGFPYKPERDGTLAEIWCEKAQKALAAHLSHHDVIEAMEKFHNYPYVEGLEPSQHTEKRGPAARRMMADYHNICLQQ